MNLVSYLDNGQLTIALTGEIDHHCAKLFMEAIAGKIEAYTPNICILDFKEVGFMDSSGIAVVINALRCMSKIDGDLKVCGLNSQPGKVFRAAGMDKLVEVREAVL